MSDLQDLANVWFGGSKRRSETGTGSDTTTTKTVTAIAVEDSSGGSVHVIMGDTVIPDEHPPTEAEEVPDDGDETATVADETDDETDVVDQPTDLPDVAVELPCTVDVREGDELLVSLYGSDGQLSPVVTAVAAGGDRTRGEVQQAAQDASHAAEMAGEVAAVATVTNQHFFTDTTGVHVTTDESDAAGGSNVLLNASGMVLRSSETPLAAFTPSGVSVYDGAGADAANVVASFSSKGVELGAPGSKQRVRMTSDRLNFVSDGEVVAHVSGSELGIANAAVTQSMAIGSLAFVPRSNGHTSLMIVGGE